MRDTGWRRGFVGCAECLNLFAVILLIFAAASPLWSWGTGTFVNSNNQVLSVTVSASPWIANLVYSSIVVACNCFQGICELCTTGSNAVYWTDISAASACDVNSVVYQKWSGPLGYCSFPGGSPPPADPSQSSLGSFGNVVPGTSFGAPPQIFALQAITICAAVFCFIALIIGCVDVGREDEGRILIVAWMNAFFTFLAWLFCVASVSLWADLAYVRALQGSPPTVYAPVWANQAQGYLTALPVQNVWYGPAWATTITSLCLTFVANALQVLSLMCRPGNEEEFVQQPGRRDTNVPPAQKGDAAPIPTVAVPVGPATVSPHAMQRQQPQPDEYNA